MHFLVTKTGLKCGVVLSLREFYDAIIIGGGGHGLGTAYYLAKEHGLKNIAVIEKGLAWWWQHWS